MSRSRQPNSCSLLASGAKRCEQLRVISQHLGLVNVNVGSRTGDQTLRVPLVSCLHNYVDRAAHVHFAHNFLNAEVTTNAVPVIFSHKIETMDIVAQEHRIVL